MRLGCEQVNQGAFMPVHTGDSGNEVGHAAEASEVRTTTRHRKYPSSVFLNAHVKHGKTVPAELRLVNHAVTVKRSRP